MVEGLCLGNLSYADRLAGDLDAARAGLSAAIAMHRELGFLPTQAFWLFNLAIVHLDAGRLEPARAAAAEAQQAYERCPNLAKSGELLAIRALMWCRLGAVADARAILNEAPGLPSLGGADALVAAARALVALAEGNAAEAELALAEATADPERCGPGTEAGLAVALARGRTSKYPI